MLLDLKSVLDLLTAVSNSFFNQEGQAALTRQILEAAIRVTQGDRGSVFLATEASQPKNTPSSFNTLLATGLDGQEIKVRVDEGVVGYVFRTNQAVNITDAQSDFRFSAQIDAKTHYQTRTILCSPIRSPKSRTLGVIEILNSKNGKFSDQDLQVLEILCFLSAVALEHSQSQNSVNLLQEQLIEARQERLDHVDGVSLHSSNRLLQDLYDKLPVFSASDSSILIEGENGTGKEMVANLLHLKSHRKKHPFVAINCAAIPESLFEAELFGVAKGAATGTSERKGKFELADDGTLFLDEIGELPLSMQAKLLRVLQEKTVTRVGSDQEPRFVNFRLIAATHHRLENLVAEGKFREDLFYRIGVVCLRIPPLRERVDDIPDLCQSILTRFMRERGWKPKKLNSDALIALKVFPWPGNIRQLQNKLEAAMVEGTDPYNINVSDLRLEEASHSHFYPGSIEKESNRELGGFDLKTNKRKMERVLIEKALQSSHGNKSQAARLLGISREGLRKAMRKK